jgi:hypothetical protein
MHRADESHDDPASSPIPESSTVPATPPAHEPGVDPEGKAPQLAGGVVGAGAGLAMGIAGGPVGMVVGALAGAVGGWWATDRITEDMGAYDENEDQYFRKHYETPEYRLADRSYEDVRPAYAYGHLAARNPAYRDRSFGEVERDLEREWTAGLRERYGEWAGAWRYAQAGYDRGRQRRGVTGRVA